MNSKVLFNKSKILDFIYFHKAILDKKFEPVCKKYQIKQSDLLLIMMLDSYPEKNSSQQICNCCELKRGNITVIVDKLVEKGMIRQETDANDRRLKNLFLLESAKPIIEDAKKIIKEHYSLILSGISEEEVEEFGRIFTKMFENLKNLPEANPLKEVL